MNSITYNDIVKEELIKDAIINNYPCQGFKEDYLVLHCLIKKYNKNISRFLEIGTNTGIGTKIIKNALGEKSVLYSMDLPIELSHIGRDYPGAAKLSRLCDLPFIQLLSDSTKFNYELIYPIHGWFIDGEHNYYNPHLESLEAIKSNAKLIVWHDVDISDVNRAIIDAFKDSDSYELFRVVDTRIAYAIRKK